MAETLPPNVTALPSPTIKVISFAVPLDNESSSLGGQQENAAGAAVGVVGTITLLNNSAMIWMGWGEMKQSSSSSSSCTADESKHKDTVGTGIPSSGMGPLVVAMPPRKQRYRGAFSEKDDATALSLLVGSEQSEDCMLAGQAASRLSKKCGIPVYVSCTLSSDTTRGMEISSKLAAGMDPSSVSQHAAALAEKEVARLLVEHIQCGSKEDK